MHLRDIQSALKGGKEPTTLELLTNAQVALLKLANLTDTDLEEGLRERLRLGREPRATDAELLVLARNVYYASNPEDMLANVTLAIAKKVREE